VKTIIVHILSTEQQKIDDAFDVVREALTDKGTDIMLFECETLTEAAIVLKEQAAKREPPAPPVVQPTAGPPGHSAFGHMYDDMGCGY
jgi:hypothetical protein